MIEKNTNRRALSEILGITETTLRSRMKSCLDQKFLNKIKGKNILFPKEANHILRELGYQ